MFLSVFIMLILFSMAEVSHFDPCWPGGFQGWDPRAPVAAEDSIESLIGSFC